MLYQLSYASMIQNLRKLTRRPTNCKTLRLPVKHFCNQLRQPWSPAAPGTLQGWPTSLYLRSMKRWIRLVPTLVTLAALAFSLHYGMPSLAAEYDQSGLALIPRDAAGLFVLDLARIRATPLYASWEQLLRAQSVVQDPGYTEFMRQTGFDYARDLDRIVVGWPAGDSPATYVIAQGRFDRARIATFLQSQTNPEGALPGRREYNGIPIFTLPASAAVSPQGNQRVVKRLAPSYLALVDDHTVVWAGGNIEPVLDCALGKADSVLASPEFQPYLPELTNTAIAGVVMAAKLRGRLSPAPETPVAFAWQHLQLLTLFAQAAGESLQVTSEGLFDTVPAAEATRDGFRGLLLLTRAGFAYANRPAQLDAKALREFLDGIEIDQAGLRVTLKAEITSQLVESLANQRRTTNQRRKLSLPPER